MLNILFPKVCGGCKEVLYPSENTLCSHCIHRLPLACHHRTTDPSMKNIFYGRLAIENATAVLYFQKKGITQEILHNLKYKGHRSISSFFGKWLGAELAEIKEYRDIDLVIPVPLHKQKLKKRGYNQVEGFAEEIAKALEIPYYDSVLIKISKTSSQVFKKRFTRFQSEEIFTIKNSHTVENKHILLVDDILTTGATLENCAIQLKKCSNVKLSLATIAIA